MVMVKKIHYKMYFQIIKDEIWCRIEKAGETSATFLDFPVCEETKVKWVALSEISVDCPDDNDYDCSAFIPEIYIYDVKATKLKDANSDKVSSFVFSLYTNDDIDKVYLSLEPLNGGIRDKKDITEAIYETEKELEFRTSDKNYLLQFKVKLVSEGRIYSAYY
jgi:hypothetical protein